MAKAIFVKPIETYSGKVSRHHNVYFRHFNGKNYAVLLVNPRTRDKSSDKERAYRARVGELSKEASRINHDESLAASYADWQSRGYSSRYRYILAELIKAR